MSGATAIETSRRRYLGILAGALTGGVSRSLVVALNLLTVSLALPYLGPQRFGGWAIIVAAQVWLQLADFGLPAGLTTPVAAALARHDFQTARRMLATALLAVSLGCCALLVLAILAIHPLDVTRFFNFEGEAVHAEFKQALTIAVAVTLIGTPNAVIARVLQVQQRPYLANIWSLIGQLAALIAVVLGALAKADIPTLTLLSVGFPALSNLACIAWFFQRQTDLRFHWRDIWISALARIWRTSAMYSALQLSGMLLLNSSIFLASSVLSPAAAAEMSVTTRLTTLCSVVVPLFSPYFWTAYTDAIVRRDFKWLRLAFWRHILLSLTVATVLSLILIPLAPSVIERWTRGEMMENVPLFAWSLGWQFVVALMNPIGAFLNAHDRYGLQTVCSMASGIAAIWLGSALAPNYGTAGIAAATVISYLALTAVPVWIQTRRLLRAQW